MARMWVYTLILLAALIVLETTKPAFAADGYYSVLYTMPHGHTVPRMPDYTPPPPIPEFAISADGSFVGEAPFAIRAAANYRSDCLTFRCNPKEGPQGCVCQAAMVAPQELKPLAQNAVTSEIK